jgi:hypothetical protein
MRFRSTSPGVRHQEARVQVMRWTSPAGKQRLLTVLDTTDAVRFREATGVALPRPPAAPRSFGCERPPGRSWHEERAAWRSALGAAMHAGDVAVVSDVADCYPSIGPRAIRMASALAGGDPDALLAFLGRTRSAGARGLPIGPTPSAVIADAILAIADLEAAAAGVVPIRWVDDVVFAGSRPAVARAERAWRAALRNLGLRDHEGKRREVRTLGDLSSPSLAARPERVIMRSS